MTSNVLTGKVIDLAEKSRIDSRFSLQCIRAAEELSLTVKPEDYVLWPAENGGLAWKVLARSRHDRVRTGGRVLCILPDSFPETPDLWKRLDSAAAVLGSGISRIRLSPPPERTVSNAGAKYPGWVHNLLDRFFPPILHQSESSENFPEYATPDEIFYERSSDSLSSRREDSSEAVSSPELIISIDAHIDIRERFVAAEAACSAGLIPSVNIAPGESGEAAFLADRSFSGGHNVILRTSDDWSGVPIFSAQTGYPILTPASEEDLAGALDWAEKQREPVLIVEPGKVSMPSRTVFKTPWDAAKQIIVKEKNEGRAGKILLIVPGTLAREASKAAERLAKDHFSVTLMSIRFMNPSDGIEISKLSRNFDLAVVADPLNCNGGLKTSLGLELIRLGEVHTVVADTPMDGKGLAELAASAHREDRFRRTVDDVRKDRWR